MKHERYVTNHFTIHFPLLRLNHITVTEQVAKVSEEFIELREEFTRHAKHERILHEMHDLFQAYITLLYVEVRPYCIDDVDAIERVNAMLETANQEHRKKIERYKAERGWM